MHPRLPRRQERPAPHTARGGSHQLPIWPKSAEKTQELPSGNFYVTEVGRPRRRRPSGQDPKVPRGAAARLRHRHRGAHPRALRRAPPTARPGARTAPPRPSRSARPANRCARRGRRRADAALLTGSGEGGSGSPRQGRHSPMGTAAAAPPAWPVSAHGTARGHARPTQKGRAPGPRRGRRCLRGSAPPLVATILPPATPPRHRGSLPPPRGDSPPHLRGPRPAGARGRTGPGCLETPAARSLAGPGWRDGIRGSLCVAIYGSVPRHG